MPADAAEVRRVTVTNNGRRDARDRADELRRDRAGAPGRGPGPSRLRQPLRRDRVARVVYGDHRDAAARARRRSGRCGASTWSPPARSGSGAVTLRDRPRPVPRPRALGAGPGWRSTERRRAVSGTTGAVLDPIFALRTRVRLAPGQSAAVAFTTLVAATPGARLRARRPLPRPARGAAGPRSRVDRHAGGAARAQLTPADAARVPGARRPPLLRQPALRARRRPSCGETAARSRSSGPSVSRATGRSCSRRSTRPEGLPTLRQLLAAHRYWRRRGMTVDLVVLNAPADQLPAGAAARRSPRADVRVRGAGVIDQPGGVFVRRRDSCRAEVLLMLRATARVHMPLRRPLARHASSRPRRRGRRRRASSRRDPVATRGPLAAAAALRALRGIVGRTLPRVLAPRTCPRHRAAHRRAGRRSGRCRAVPRCARQRLRRTRRRAATTRSGSAATGRAPRALGQRRRQPARRLRRHRARRPASPGRRTATSSGSRRGTTIR